MTLENGYLLNQRYRILDILGQGGMGAVYRAIDENLDIIVAVKENSFLTEEYARQFQREAKILASLRHPNLPRVFDYFVIDQEGQYLVMDYIEGHDLRQWMSLEDNISEIEAIQIGISICDALIYLHTRDPVITHRDIKPGNIKITPEGEVVLVDFGLAKITSTSEMTSTAAKAMTPGYSPPEQYGEASTDHRSDIYSLGATLYAALAAYLPEDSLARATGNTKLTPLRKYNLQVSTKTASVIEKALNLQFKDRWQSASAFKDALLQAREDIPRSEWNTHRITAASQQDPEFTVDNNPTTPFSQRLQNLFQNKTDYGKKPDPMWLVLVAIFFILVVILGISLVWPEGLQRLFLASFNEDSTESQVFALDQNTPTSSFEFDGEETPRPILDQTRLSNISNSYTITPSPTSVGGGSGMIAFVSERSGIPQIWLLNVANQEVEQITALDDGACQPDWSPNGVQIVFTTPCSGKRSRYPGSSLYIINVESGHLERVPASLEGDFSPAWSPDGQHIAYTSLINGKKQLMKFNVEDVSLTRLSDGTYDDSEPSWSPDGERLIFVRVRGFAQIWLMDANGDNPVQFSLSGTIDNSNPTWYHGENLILFSQALGPGSPSKQVYGMRLEDIGKTEEYLVIPGIRFDYTPLMDNITVSPDGYWMAFDMWYFDVLSDIYMMNFPGANLVQMTDHPAMDYEPAWRPLP